MGTCQTWQKAMEHVLDVREQDIAAYLMSIKDLLPDRIAASLERNGVFTPPPQPVSDPALQSIERLMQHELERWPPLSGSMQSEPGVSVIDSGVCEIYTRIRAAIWQWPEFAGLTRGTKAILEVIIELARDEGFPWYVPVCATDVRRLARLAEGSFCRSLRELDCLAISRDAAMYRPTDDLGIPDRAFDDGELDRVPIDPPRPLTPQFVLRYRRGIPWNRKRAAWWINYDLLCSTGRMQPMFDVNLRRLVPPYFQRRRKMGLQRREVFSPEWIAEQREAASQRGPMMPFATRSPRWRLPATNRHCEGADSLPQAASP